MTMAFITTEQRKYIVAHINDRPRTAVARAAGVSMSAMYRIVRECGGSMLYERTRRNPWHVELVKKYYPTMTGSEMQTKFGISKKLFERIARELKLKHTPETLQRIEGKKKRIWMDCLVNINFGKLGRKRSALYKMEYYRKWEGKPQKTKLRLAETSYKVYKAKWNLIKRHGYVETTDAYTLMYDKGTRRMNEKYYTEKYGLKFIEDNGSI